MQKKNPITELLQPVAKRWYYIVICMLIAGAIATVHLFRTNPIYQATATIKIENGEAGLNNLNLYRNFDVFKQDNKVETEVEVLKSRYLFEKALSKVDFDVEYYRVGRFKSIELYNDCPFVIQYDIQDNSFYKQDVQLSYAGNNAFDLMYTLNGVPIKKRTHFGKDNFINTLKFRIDKNNTYLKEKPRSLDGGVFKFVVYSKPALATHLTEGNLMVKAVGKDINIIRIYFDHEVAAKAMKMVNALAETYIEDGILTKTDAASTTFNFVSDQLDHVSDDLSKAQNDIKDYKTIKGIVNLNQETEARLRTLGQLEIQQVNLQMDLAALDNMSEYIRRNMEIPYSAPEYQTVLDPLFIEGISTLNKKYREKKELLQKFTEEDPKLMQINSDIESLRISTKEGIVNTRKKLMVRMDEINSYMLSLRSDFNSIPEKESQLQALNREFVLNEKVYNFLLEKRTEAIIAKSAMVSFNKILESAQMPRLQKFPQPNMIMALALMLGFMTGLALIYIRNYFVPKVTSREDLERITDVPFLMNIERVHDQNEDQIPMPFINLGTKIMMLSETKKNLFITVTSTKRGEGKTYVASNLAKVLSTMDKKVLLVDMDIYNPGVEEVFGLQYQNNMAQVYSGNMDLMEAIQITSYPNLDVLNTGKLKAGINTFISSDKTGSMLQQIRSHYDVVIFDTPEAGLYMDAVPVMKISDINLYIVRANATKAALLSNAEVLKEEYRIPEVYHVLNAVNEKRNYTGYFPEKKLEQQSELGDQLVGVLKKMNLWL